MKTLNIYRLVSPDVSSQIPQYPVTHVTQSGAHRHIHLSSSAPRLTKVTISRLPAPTLQIRLRGLQILVQQLLQSREILVKGLQQGSADNCPACRLTAELQNAAGGALR